MSKNNITGDNLTSKPATESYRDGWDRIFQKQSTIDDMRKSIFDKYDADMARYDADIAAANGMRNTAIIAKNKALGDSPLFCPECDAMHLIKDLTYIQTHWYTRPHGCTGGDYWTEGEGNTICPSCNTRLRFMDEQYQDMKYQFKQIVEEHKH